MKNEMFDIYEHDKTMDWVATCALPEKLNAERYIGFDDWVLPTVDELKLIQLTGIFPHIGLAWSSSAYVGKSNYAWVVYFDDGYVVSDYRFNYNHVRLVRASQLFAIGEYAVQKVIGARATHLP